ncbi:helix-turn-helix domain-containing protein [Herbaspirillum camelliae]|uniref:helix-turn-helix domain-containing protein n=1 Tax=Herbaspirillum camelliae TaxID=1892903 RepID=UPI000949DFF7|nr:helix-turn-helix domain-containing protein [Herbaspirillum camelliae]
MATQDSFPYREFGELLAKLRAAAGYAKQQELAAILGVKQQTVSRWEKGQGRPRATEISRLERVVGAKDGELAQAAGFHEMAVEPQRETSTSFDKPLPLSALTPDTFELFCTAFLDRLYKPMGGNVHRYGSTGHKQHGIDIVADGPFGIHSFQCKRVIEFGPQKVHLAVATQTFVADLKVLLLSSVASTSARDAMAAHATWQMWDREDITRKFHELPLCDRLDLVDRFFHGQRFDLLGEEEPGPIQDEDRFFAQFLVQERFFNHAWSLVGREDEVKQLVDSLGDEKKSLTYLMGNPGAGKTRLLREIARQYAKGTIRMRFVSPTEEVKAHHLDGLRDRGGAVNVLVIDDAHDREDMGSMLQYAADPRNNTRLLVALRPYGEASLVNQAAGFSLTDSLVTRVEMKPQTKEQARKLAESILAESGAALDAAAEIAEATYTTPLVTVLAAQLVAKDAISLQLLGNSDEFRKYVLSRLQDVITAKLVPKHEEGKLRAVLRVTALLQPVIPDDPNLLKILADVEGVSDSDSKRLMILLGQAGVLFKRGIRSRLAPDLLADEIIRSNYLQPNGVADEGIGAIFDIANTDHLRNLLVNLARLDWRLREGKTDDSVVMSSLEQRLMWHGDYVNRHVQAVEAMAYYQPRFALNFAKRLINDGHGDDSHVCNIVRNASFTYDHVEEGCSLLWKAGRNDGRAMHQQPGHAIRILKEMAKFQLNKPVDYVQKVVSFALTLLERPAALTSLHTPFEILLGPLETEFESTRYTRGSMEITRYRVALGRVKEVRNQVTNALLKYLRQGNSRLAFLAAQTWQAALSGALPGDVSADEWAGEHANHLKEIGTIVDEVYLSPVVLVRLAQSLRWHAYHGKPETASLAKPILDVLERDLRTRMTRALIDGWGTETSKTEQYLGQPDFDKARRELCTEIMAAFPDVSALYGEIDSCLAEMESLGPGYGAPFIFVGYLLDASPALATEVLIRNVNGSAGNMEKYVAKALSVVVSAGDPKLVQKYVERSMQSEKELKQLTEAYAGYQPSTPYRPDEIELFERIFASKDESVLFASASLLRQIAVTNPVLAMKLACSADFNLYPHVTHEYFMWIAGASVIPPEIVESNRERLLQKLEGLKELEDYWVRAFLAQSVEKNPRAVVNLVKARMIECARQGTWRFTPLYKEYGGASEGIGFDKIESGAQYLTEFLDWVLLNAKEEGSLHRVGGVVAGMWGSYDAELLKALIAWMEQGALDRAIIVAMIVREAQNSFVYAFPELIRTLFNVAERIDDEAVEEIRAAVVAATGGGVRHGTPGEPFPEDVKLEKYSQEMLKTLSRAEPTYDLYDSLLNSARRNMSMDKRTRIFDDDDE